MGKAEVGTPKHLSNKMRSRGLQRLRWYCQACERQMRDENGFRMHVNSEPHHRQMMLISQNPGKQIADYSRQFKHDFLQLLRTAHGEKRVHVNHFYQEYIAHKDHVHMNATQWKTLSEFAKSLGREGTCRVDQDEKGSLFVAWIDNSPESLARQQAIRRKEQLERGDEERAQTLLQAQIATAQRERQDKLAALTDSALDAAASEVGASLDESRPPPAEKIKISFGIKPKSIDVSAFAASAAATGPETGSSPMSLSKPKNVLATASSKGNPLKVDAAARSSVPPDTGSLKRMSGAMALIQEEERRRQRSDQRSRPY